MTDAEKFATVFHAAATGVMHSYDNCGTFSSSDYSRDRALAGALRAVGDVFAKIAEAEKLEPTGPQ